jgi:pyruvate, orthophosphate dikinase
MFKSKALEINLARTQVDVAIDPRYLCLQEVMADYFGLMVRLEAFLKEVAHPFKNWQVIVDGARTFALDYFHLFKQHPQGPPAVERLIEIFAMALAHDTPPGVKVDAADNLILFLQKITKSADGELPRFQTVITHAFKIIDGQPDNTFDLFVRSFFSLKRLAQDVASALEQPDVDFTCINKVLIRFFEKTYGYWLDETDPLATFLAEADQEVNDPGLEEIFLPITHATIRSQQHRLKEIVAHGNLASGHMMQSLLTLTDHHQMVRAYRQIPQKLLESSDRIDRGNRRKVIFQFQTMAIAGAAITHEDTLRDINRTLSWLIANQSTHYVHTLIEKTFSILKANVQRYPTTALACVDNMGQGIFNTNDPELIGFFIDAAIDLGFQTPMIRGVGNDWQIQVNPAHIQNIRTWLKLAQLRPRQATRLISNLIIYLAIGGVYIKDTDLFGRDVTRFLNSDIGPVYNLAKQLARLFPVYFNDIGAEGELRDTSTRIDEICHRRDPLIHFLRKQSHVESSNRVIGLMEATLHFWATKDKSQLTAFLPPTIFTAIAKQGPYLDGVHTVVSALQQAGLNLPADFLTYPSDPLRELVQNVARTSAADRERIVLFADLYKLLNHKYNLNFINIQHHLNQLSAEAFPELRRLKTALKEPDLQTKIFKLLDYLELLKSLILSPSHFEIREDIYKKRHFTVDIPSMYGSYHELKFDAMGLTLRLEALVSALLEELVRSIDLSLITKATCHQIYDRLVLFDKALKVDGIASAELEHQVELLVHSLEIRGFSFSQFLDIFKGLSQAVKNIIHDYFNSVHGENLTRILTRMPPDQMQTKYCSNDEPASENEKLCHRNSEIFLRDRLALSLGLQQLDLFLTRILNTLFLQSSKLPKDKLRRLLNYDPQRAITCLHRPNTKTTSIIDLGNKGLNMLKLHNFGLPVPPAFIITTEVFRCQEIIQSFAPAQANFKEQITRHIQSIEQLTGKRFGNADNPLLFSVRSGSSISQPGMMETFLNVGMNEKIAHGLAVASGNGWFAWDSYRRFVQCCGMASGLARDDFDAIINEFKKTSGLPLKREFTAEQMQHVAMAYKKRLIDDGIELLETPIDQLFWIIQCVIDSWQSERAKTYRQIMGISEDWGTAVTVQTMVYGNLSPHSGTGVVFTHNPRWSGDSLSLWGDFSLENQGEDVVSGLVNTLPISIKQQEIEMRDTDMTLETHFPEIYKSMQQMAHTLVSTKGWSPQEMEFTFESPSVDDLYLLQTRDMAIREHQQVLTFDPAQVNPADYLGHGIGVGGGAMSGRLVFSLEEIAQWRHREPHTQLILVRGDTVPDDIKEIHAADGVLTARGGVTSHASVVAHRLGKTCVVGCGSMICDETRQTVEFGHHQLHAGGHISIDGREGSVYQGKIEVNGPP